MISTNRTGRKALRTALHLSLATSPRLQDTAYGRHCAVARGASGYPAGDLTVGYEAEHPTTVVVRPQASTGRHAYVQAVEDWPTQPIRMVEEPVTQPIRVPRALLAAFVPVPAATS